MKTFLIRSLCLFAIFVTASLSSRALAADWAASFGGITGSVAYPQATATDAAGNTYLVGYFDGTTMTLGSVTLTRIGSRDAFVAKLDSSGTVLWAKNFGGSGATTIGEGIAVDGSGNVYVGGYVVGASLSTPALTLIGNQDAFAFKMDSTGAMTWVKSFGGSGAAAACYSIAVDGSGNVYLSGFFSNANLTTPVLTKIGTEDAFAFKLSPTGVPTWAKNFGGSGAYAYGQSIAADSSGNVYLGGYFRLANLTTPALTRIGNQDAFAFKLDSTGTTTWTKSFGGSGASAIGYSIAVDGSGNVYLGGNFGGASLSTPSLTKLGTTDAFAFKLSSAGATTWAKNFGGSGASASGYSIATDGIGNVYLGGYFNTANLTTPALSRIGNQDAFAFKLSSTGATTWAKNFGGSGASATGRGIAVSSSGGNVYLGGYYSANLTTPALTRNGGQDAFAFKLDSTGATTWAKNFATKGPGSTYSYATATDGAGNTYLAGHFDTLSQTIGSFTMTRIGNVDAFVAKLNPSGTVLWAKNFGGSGASANGYSIAVDGSGNAYFGGYFNSANLTTPALTKIGTQDAFVIKLDSSGTTVWSKNFGGSGASASVNGIAVDGSANVYLGGYFNSANLTTPALTKIGSQDAFAFKLSSAGATTWAKNFGGSSASALGQSIAVDGSGNVYLGGYFYNASLSTPALTKLGTYDAFAFKLNSAGATTWAKNFGGSGTSASASSITADGSGNVYLAGYFYVGNLTTPALTKIGNKDAFAFKLDNSGATTWAKNFGGSGAYASAGSIAADGSGNIYMGGNFSSADLTTPALTRIGSQDGFALKLSSAGLTIWAKNFGGIGASVYGNGIAFDSSQNIHLAGYFTDADLTTPALTKNGGKDSFIITTLANLAPTASAPTNQTAIEGSAKSFPLGSFSDSEGGPWTVTVTWGDGTPDTVFSASSAGSISSQSHTYADNGTYTATIAVRDSAPLTGSASFTVTVHNVAPSVNAGTNQTVTLGNTVYLSSTTFNDIGSVDTHTATINWGDGTGSKPGTVSEAGGNGTVGGNHVYTGTGTFTVSVTVCDNNGGCGTGTLSVIVSPPAFPTLTTPTVTNLAAGSATLIIQSDSDSTGYFTLLAGSGTPCGSSDQIAAGEDSTGNAAFRHGSLSLAANTPGFYTVRNLGAETPYTVCFTARKTVALAPTPATSNFTTTAMTAVAAPQWSALWSSYKYGYNDSPALAFAPDGTPYLALQDSTNSGKATVMRYSGGTWNLVGNGGFTDGLASGLVITFAPDGTPYVACNDNYGIGKVMKLVGETWTPVGGVFSTGNPTAIALSFAPDGSPMMMYNDYSGVASIANFSGGSWSTTPSGLSGGNGYQPAFAPDGTPYVVAWDNYQVTVMKFADGTWTQVGSPWSDSHSMSGGFLAFAPDGTPYLGANSWQPINMSGETLFTVSRLSNNTWSAIANPVIGSVVVGVTWNGGLTIGPDGMPQVAVGNGVLQQTGTTWKPAGDPTIAAASPGPCTLVHSPDGTLHAACTGYNSSEITILRYGAATTVTGISRHNPATVTVGGNGTVTFRLTFAEPVSGVSLSNFDLDINPTGAYITGVSPVGGEPASQWDITVVTGTTEGSVTLRLFSSAGITPAVAAIVPYAPIQGSYLVDMTPPTVTIGIPTPSSVQNNAVDYLISYGDLHFATSTLTAGNVNLNTTGTASGTVSVSGSGASRTVTIGNITGTGTLGITLAAATATDEAGNPAPGTGPSATFSAPLGTAPTVTVPSITATAASSVTLSFQSSTSGTGYFTMLSGSSAVCGSGPQTRGGLDSTGAPAFRFGSLRLTAGTPGIYTVRNLIHNSPYTVCFTADNGGFTVQPSAARTAFTTAAAASYANPAWSTVGSVLASNANQAALAFAPDGTPYLTYFDGYSNLMTVTSYTAGTWNVVGSPLASSYPSYETQPLVFSPDGTPYLAYPDSTVGGITVAKLVNGSWITVGTQGSAGSGYNYTFTIAPDGTPWVASTNYADWVISHFDGTAWTAVTSHTGSYGPASLRFGPSGTPYLMLTTPSDPPMNFQLNLYKYSNGAWSNVGDAVTIPNGPSTLSVAPDGTPYVTTVDQYGILQVQRLSNGTWAGVGTSISTLTQYGWPGNLTFSAEGTPYLSYGGQTSAIAKLNGNSWITVFSSSQVTPVVAFAPNGTAYASFSLGGSPTVLKYATAGTPPPVTIGRLSPASLATNASQVTFRATFATPVSGVSLANFTLNFASPDASIISVTPVGTPPTTRWDIAVATGTGDGQLGLLVNGIGITPALMGPPSLTDQSYYLDRTPPGVMPVLVAAVPFSSPQAVTLQCNDYGGFASGCAAIYYCFGDGCTPTTRYNASFEVYGAKTVNFYAVDNAGNSSGTQSAVIAAYAPEYPVNLSVNGTGSGTVTSSPSGIACNTGCSASFTAGFPVTLQAVAAEYSLFTGWSGACSGTADCTVPMDDVVGITATFNKDTVHAVRCDTPSINYYSSIANGYSSMPTAGILKLWGQDFSGNVTFSLNKTVTLKGGFNGDYSDTPGFSTIVGTMTVSSGTVTVENIAVR